MSNSEHEGHEDIHGIKVRPPTLDLFKMVVAKLQAEANTMMWMWSGHYRQADHCEGSIG